MTLAASASLPRWIYVPAALGALFVAADGEVEFHPFGLVDFAVSDAIQLNPAWAPDPTFASAFGPGLWTLQPNTFVWYLLEGAGEPLLEPIGKWFMAGAPVRDGWLDSLAAQVRWLGERLEWHLLGNHLFVIGGKGASGPLATVESALVSGSTIANFAADAVRRLPNSSRNRQRP